MTETKRTVAPCVTMRTEDLHAMIEAAARKAADEAVKA